MNKSTDFIILKAETYEQEGDEKFRFAVSTTDDEDTSGVIFMFNDYTLVECGGDVQAQCFVHFGETKDDKIVPITKNDPRYDKLYEKAHEILEQITKPHIDELLSMTEN
jgi:hypothetical protein